MRIPRSYYGHLTHGQCSRIRSEVLDAELFGGDVVVAKDELAQRYGVHRAIINRVCRGRPAIFDAYLEEVGW